MAVKTWDKVGDPKTLAIGYKKGMIRQCFKEPDSGEIVERDLFNSPVTACMILPITKEGAVVAVKQFRFGVSQVTLELPAGGIDPSETPSEAASRELLEETGYTAMRLSPLLLEIIFADPAACNWGFHPFLGIDCVYKSEPNPDRYEKIEIELIPLREWFEMIYAGKVKSNIAISTTLLACPHLKLNSYF